MASKPEGSDPDEPSGEAAGDDEPVESGANAEKEADVEESEPEGEDSDDDDDDDDDDDEEAERQRRLRAKARRKLKKKKKRPKPPLPRTEQELDAPNVQTLWMLGALAASVVIMAGAARFACNYHPDETKNPREIASAELAKDPKDAAIAFQQAWATRNYARALEFAKGKAMADLQQAKQQCDGDPGCAKQAQELSSKVLTTGELLTRQAMAAMIRVRSTGVPAGSESFLVDVEQDGTTWKVAARREDRGGPVPGTTVGNAPAMQIAPPSGLPAPPASAPGKGPGLIPSKP